ncbi:MAG: ABC transporter substrate-binding protein [Treponema sp.]|nr:ABC transporter substrate-binding protein [Treponema sp.]
MKKNAVRVLTAIFAVSLALAACGGGQARDTNRLIVIAPGGEAPSLDPVLANHPASSQVMRQIYNTLFNQDSATLAILPGLAERYQFEDDANGQPTRLRLFLRQGVRFHNGDYLTAGDVRFSLERAAASPVIGFISRQIQSVEVIGDYEVLVTLVAPFMPILNNLAHTAMSIVSERAVIEGGADFARNPVGTGPMKFVNWIAGDRIELTRWDGYFGPAPRIRDITIRHISDPATALLELETGGADILLTVTPHDIGRVQADPNLRLIRTMGLGMNFIGLNNSRPPLDNVLVRQAIAHAVDKDALVRSVFQGVGRPGSAPVPSTVWASAAGQLQPHEFNPDRARELLAQAGFPNGFATTITAANAASPRDTAELLRNMLAQVGIDAEIRILEAAAWGTFSADGLQDIGIHSWSTVTGDPDYALEILHSRSHGAAGNRVFYSNAEVDRLLDAARMETDRGRREQLYLEAQRIIHSEAPWIYTHEIEIVAATRSDVRGFVASSTVHHPLWTVYFE